MADFRMPAMMVADGEIRIPIKAGGFTFDGEAVVIQLEEAGESTSKAARKPRQPRQQAGGTDEQAAD